MQIPRSDRINNRDLLAPANPDLVNKRLPEESGGGQTTTKENHQKTVIHQTQDWNPQGKRRFGRPRKA